MNITNSPQRILRTVPWYFCLLVVLVPLCAASAQPVVGHWHKKHSREHRHFGHFNGALQYNALPIDADVTETANTPTSPSTGLVAPVNGTPPESIAPATALVTAKPTVISVKPKTAAIPAKKPPMRVQTSPLDMTRDSGLPSLTALSSQPLHEAGQLNVTGQIVRMLGSLLLVLLMILGAVRLLRHFRMIPNAQAKGAGQTYSQSNRAQPLPSGPAGWIAAAQLAGKPTVEDFYPASTVTTKLDDTNSSFKLLSSLNLPGSTASVHLVQAAQKMLVLGSTPSAGVTLLTEVDVQPRSTAEMTSKQSEPAKVERAEASKEEIDYDDDDALIAFADILREKAGLPTAGYRSDVLALDQVDARLSATQERLNARLNAGAELSSASSTPAETTPRRRASKSVEPKG